MPTIIITGASRGIGYATAKQLSQNPDNHIIATARNENKLLQLTREAAHNNITAITGDLQNPDQLVRDIAAEVQQVDALLNNAGLLINKPFSELSPADWQSLWEVNVIAPASLIKGLIPQLEASAQAHVVNIGSMGGFQGSSKFPGLSAYSTTKAAIASLSECLAEELKTQNIAVNCLALGAVQTEMLEEAFPGMQAPVSSTKMGAYIANFLLTGHHFHNGKVIPVSVSTP